MADGVPLVLQLQAKAVDPEISVSELLRFAKLIATKLGQSDALKWIDRELDGYMGCKQEDTPAYRKITGVLKAKNPYLGWKDVQFENAQLAKDCCYASLGTQVGLIEKELSQSDKGRVHLVFNMDPEIKKLLTDYIKPKMDVNLFLSESQLWGVLDAVRNLILNWTLDLEKAGVLGEGLMFTKEEKMEAATVTNNFIQNVGVFGNVSDRAKVINTQSAFSGLDTAAVMDFATRTLGALHQLPPETKKELEPLLLQIQTESSKAEPEKSQIRKLLSSVQTVAEGAAGNLVAAGVIQMATKLLGA